MKALLISMGTRGDVEPFLAVGEVLRERGWDVVCLFPEQFRGMAEAMGFRFHGFSEEFLKLIEGGDAKEILGGEGGAFSRLKNWFSLARKGMKLAGESVEIQHRVQIDEAPDRIIYHPKCNTAIVWGMANPGKAIQLATIPGLAHAVDDFAPMWKDLGRTVNRASYRLINWFKAFAVKKFTKKFIRDLGFTKLSVAEINRAMLETETTIYTVSPSLFERPAYWPETAQIVGYFERDKAADWKPDELLLKFLKTHEKIVFISFGSMTNTKTREKTEAIVNALKRNNIPAIINTSWGGLCEIEEAPEHVMFVSDDDWLYPHIYAVVHHGGSGSTHMAAKYGLTGLTAATPENASGCCRIRYLTTKHMNDKNNLSTVSAFLDEQKHPLRDVIDHLRNCIASARPDLAENIKWNGPNFTHNGKDRITLKIHPPTSIQVIFHCGAKATEQTASKLIGDGLGILVWRGNDRAIATFKNLAEAQSRTEALQKIVKDWIDAARTI